MRRPTGFWLNPLFRMFFAVVLTGAFVLRIGFLGAGLPLVASPQEQQVVSSAMGFDVSENGPAPRADAVATYVCSLVYAAYYAVGHAVGLFDSVLDFGAAFFHDPAPFYLLARLVSVAVGMLSVCLAFAVVSRLLGRWAGLAASLLVAVSPSCVAHAHVAQSSGFALALVLLGWWAVLSAPPSRRAIFGDLIFGLCVGVATDATPLVVMVLPAYVAMRLWRLREHRSVVGTLGLGVGVGAFWLGMMVVGGSADAVWAALSSLSTARHLEAVGAVSSLVVCGSVVALVWCSLRRRLQAAPTAAVALVGALVLAWPALRQSVEDNAVRSVPAVPVQAAVWITRHLPADSTILIAEGGPSALQLPRSERSWRRELVRVDARGAGPQRHSRTYCLLGMYAARSQPGPAFDVMTLPTQYLTGEALRGPSSAAEWLGAPVQYIVTSGSLDLSEAPPAGEHARFATGACWLVARFGDLEDASGRVTIWGTSAARLGSQAPSVQWLMRNASDLAQADLREQLGLGPRSHASA